MNRSRSIYKNSSGKKFKNFCLLVIPVKEVVLEVLNFFSITHERHCAKITVSIITGLVQFIKIPAERNLEIFPSCSFNFFFPSRTKDTVQKYK